VQPSIISTRVTGAFAALLLMLVVTFVATVHGAARLADLDAAVTRARDVLAEIGATRGALREAEHARRGYLLTREDERLKLYLVAMQDTVAHLDRLRDLTADDPGQRHRVDAIGPLVAQQLTRVTNTVASAAEGKGVPAGVEPLPDDGTIVGEQMRGLAVELEDGERARLREREADANVRTVTVIRGFGAVALAALLLLGAAYYVLDRDAAVHAAVLEELHMYARGTTSAEHARPPETARSETSGGTHALSD
jgi:CHASE3 domain sensor protein